VILVICLKIGDAPTVLISTVCTQLATCSQPIIDFLEKSEPRPADLTSPTMNDNPPQPGKVKQAMYEMPKSVFLAFITSVPFDAISIPKQYTSDRQKDYVAFVDAITSRLNKILHESAPTKTSPKKVLAAWTIRENPSTPTPIYTTPAISSIPISSNQPPAIVSKRDSRNVSVGDDEDIFAIRTGCPAASQNSLSSNDRRMPSPVLPFIGIVA
jgi:hypothetical protein